MRSVILIFIDLSSDRSLAVLPLLGCGKCDSPIGLLGSGITSGITSSGAVCISETTCRTVSVTFGSIEVTVSSVSRTERVGNISSKPIGSRTSSCCDLISQLNIRTGSEKVFSSFERT